MWPSSTASSETFNAGRKLLQGLIDHYCEDRGIFDGDKSLFRGWIETESAHNQYALRYEPQFYLAYIKPNISDWNIDKTEARARAFSWGYLQIMGQVARERGFTPKYLSELMDPYVNLKYAVKHLQWGRERGDGSWVQSLAAYNGGLRQNREEPYRNASYVQKVKSNAETFQ